jgi:regulator of protease activity HflC (stomatin/prohibitin superfamily)
MEWLNRLVDKLLSILPEIHTLEPNERGARTTGGKRYRIIGPGWYFVWPIVQKLLYMEIVTQVVDLKSQSVWTADGIELVTSGAIRYRIVDIEKALFAVQDVDKALSTLALGVILEYVNARSVADCRNIKDVKVELRRALAEEASGWGVKIEQVYLTDFGKVMSLRLFGDSLGSKLC